MAIAMLCTRSAVPISVLPSGLILFTRGALRHDSTNRTRKPRMVFPSSSIAGSLGSSMPSSASSLHARRITAPESDR